MKDTYFSGYGSFLSIRAQREEGAVQLSLGRPCRQYQEQGVRRMDNGMELLRLLPTVPDGNVQLRQTPVLLTLRCGQNAFLHFCFVQPNVLRICGQGMDLRIRGTLKEHEAMIDRLDGSYQLCFFEGIGEMLLEPLAGTARLLSKWDWTRAGSDRAAIDFCRDALGRLDLCIYYGDENLCRHVPMASFERQVVAAEEAYGAFCAALSSPQSREEAAFLWQCHAGGKGKIKNILPMSTQRGEVLFTGSALMAMVQAETPDASIASFLAPFRYQHASGQLPCYLDDRYRDDRYAAPPVHAFALSYLLKRGRFADDAAQARQLYQPLSRWYGWWKRERRLDEEHGFWCFDSSEYGIPENRGQLREADESPMLTAQLLVLADALNVLARRIGEEQESTEELVECLKRLSINGRYCNRGLCSARMAPVSALEQLLIDLLVKDTANGLISADVSALLRQDGRKHPVWMMLWAYQALLERQMPQEAQSVAAYPNAFPVQGDCADHAAVLLLQRFGQ